MDASWSIYKCLAVRTGIRSMDRNIRAFKPAAATYYIDIDSERGNVCGTVLTTRLFALHLSMRTVRYGIDISILLAVQHVIDNKQDKSQTGILIS